MSADGGGSKEMAETCHLLYGNYQEIQTAEWQMQCLIQAKKVIKL